MERPIRLMSVLDLLPPKVYQFFALLEYLPDLLTARCE